MVVAMKTKNNFVLGIAIYRCGEEGAKSAKNPHCSFILHVQQRRQAHILIFDTLTSFGHNLITSFHCFERVSTKAQCEP